ncbi:MAG: secondary thiamine-phosphate synthase enzyme YjbQ [Candidatus Hermodarchaeota archaeon]
MTVILETFDIKTKAYYDVINITSHVQNIVNSSSLKNGIVNIHVAGSTGAITTVEYEPGLVQTDIKEFLEKIIPYKKDYAHHKTWHDYNGAGHLRSFLIKTSQTFPFQNKKLILGSWQNIVFVENDEKSRHRQIFVTIIGE